MLNLEPIDGFVRALAGAGDVRLSAYTLRPGKVLDALVAAARRGAAVSVRLERAPYEPTGSHELATQNRKTVSRLRAAGADAALTAPGDPPLHLKAALTDRTAWLDDRNWAGGDHEHLVRDRDADDVGVVRSALAGRPAADGHLATTKSRALRLEADVIDHAGSSPLDVESESFGSGAIDNRLLARAKAGAPTRLIVAGREYAQPANLRERRELARLAALGVEVRIGDPAHGDLDEKCAVSAHDGWIGSANATYARGPNGAQRDWGLASRQRALIAGLERAFEQNWRAAQPLPGGSGAGRHSVATSEAASAITDPSV